MKGSHPARVAAIVTAVFLLAVTALMARSAGLLGTLGPGSLVRRLIPQPLDERKHST